MLPKIKTARNSQLQRQILKKAGYDYGGFDDDKYGVTKAEEVQQIITEEDIEEPTKLEGHCHPKDRRKSYLGNPRKPTQSTLENPKKLLENSRRKSIQTERRQHSEMQIKTKVINFSKIENKLGGFLEKTFEKKQSERELDAMIQQNETKEAEQKQQQINEYLDEIKNFTIPKIEPQLNLNLPKFESRDIYPPSILKKPRYEEKRKNFSIDHYEPFMGSRPSIFDSRDASQLLKNYSPDIGKNQFSLQIKSSRAYDESQHQNLKDIIENLDKIALSKKKEKLKNKQNDDSKIYKAVNMNFSMEKKIRSKHFELRSKSTIKPCGSDFHGPQYLQSQWSDIKAKTFQRREFVKDLAKQQKYVVKMDDMNKTVDFNYTRSKSKKALKQFITPIRQEILLGIERNREAFGMPKAPQNVYHKLQKYFERPYDKRDSIISEPSDPKKSKKVEISHNRILDIKQQLRDLISEHIDSQNITKQSVLDLFGPGKDNTRSLSKLKIIKGKSHIFDAIQELPEYQLTRLVEILLEEQKNIVRKFEPEESNVYQSQIFSSRMQNESQSNLNFRINAFENTIQIENNYRKNMIRIGSIQSIQQVQDSQNFDETEQDEEDLTPYQPINKLQDTKNLNLPKMLPITLSNPSIYNINKSGYQLDQSDIIKKQIKVEAINKMSALPKDEIQTILCLNEKIIQQGDQQKQAPQKVTFNHQSHVVYHSLKGKCLRDIYMEILDIKLLNSPIFSGYFGENIYNNSQHLLDMFKDLPYEPVVQNTIQRDEVFNSPYEIDTFFKLDENIELQTHLTYGQQQYYHNMTQMYEVNRDMNQEFKRQQIKVHQKNNFTELFSNMTNTITEHQPLQIGLGTEKIDLNEMARKYKSGLYYLMCVVDQKLKIIQEKNDLNEYKRGKSIKMANKFAQKQKKKREDNQIFKKIEQYNQVNEDSQKMILLHSSKIAQSRGPKPSARAYFGCTYLNGKFYFYGGKNNEIMNDLRSLNLQQMEWKHEDQKNHLVDHTKIYMSNEQVFEIDLLKKRFSCSLSHYKNYLLVFGGGGNFIDSLQKRETYNDLSLWDLSKGDFWVDLNDNINKMERKKEIMKIAQVDLAQPKYDIVDYGRPLRRTQHVAAVYGGCLVIHGGLQGEMGQVLDDLALYDIALGMWVKFKKPKKVHTTICARYQHSMTAVVDKVEKNDTRIMWIQPPQKLSGLFIFGGLNSKNQPKNDLYLITPHYEKNRKYLTFEKANFKKSVKTTICYNITQLSPSGRPPAPRFAHASCYIQHYLVIHGGRNDDIYQSLQNVALNDLHLYDVLQNCWLSVAIYGEIPTSRWGHQMCLEDANDDYQGNRVIIFGGVNLNSFFDSSIYCINFDESQILDFQTRNNIKIEELYYQGQQMLNK